MKSQHEAKAEADDGGKPEAGRREEKKADGLRLVDRDRQLMGMLATVRYLMMLQLQRVLFAGRTTSVNLEKRLLQLAGLGKHGVAQAYLKRLRYVAWDGRPQEAWTLTALGYTIAESVLPQVRRPASEVGVHFMEHGLMLNELYVQLLEAPLLRALAAAREKAKGAERPSREFTKAKGGIYARAHHPGFRWWAQEEVRLPWKQHNKRKDKTYDRLIIPDAVLELPGARRRYFLECETGSHSVTAESEEKTGATLAKVRHYQEYLYGSAGDRWDADQSSWYSRQYPDGFKPYVLFLVRPGTRQGTVRKAIAEWKAEDDSRRLRADALTVQGAAAEFLALLGDAPGPLPVADPSKLGDAEIASLVTFFAAYRTDLKRRQSAAAVNAAPMPYAVEEYKAVKALVGRLAAIGK